MKREAMQRLANEDLMTLVDRKDPLAFEVFYERRGGEMEPLTSFRPRRDGTDEVVLAEALNGAEAVLVTEEPRRVGASPSTAPVLRASLG